MTEVRGPLPTIMPGLQDVLERLRKEILEPIHSNPPKTAETQTTTTRPVPLSTTPPNQTYFPPLARYPIDLRDPSDPLRNIGRGDLDPFGHGGGMLFNPPMNFPPVGGLGPLGGPGRLNIPPGARFDPFGPPGPNNRTGPDNDHFRPPGGFDNMFM